MYHYRVTAYRNLQKVVDETKIISGADLELNGVEPSFVGLLDLVNRWNQRGRIGIEKGKLIYIYTAHQRHFLAPES